MQLQQLLYLKTVGETKSIRKASEKLFVSQQAISQSIMKLEDEYSVPLLNRSVHGVTLTEAGSHAAAVAEQVLSLTQDLEHYFTKQSTMLQGGQLRIAAINSITYYVLPDAQIEFMQQHPSTELHIDSLGTKSVIEKVAARECEIGFFGNPYINDKPLFHIKPPLHFVALSRYDYRVAISPNSPLNNYNTLSIKSVLHYPIFFLREQLQDSLEDYMPYRVLSQFGKVDAIVADSIRVMSRMVEADMGVAISTDGIFTQDVTDQGITKPLRDNIYGYFGYLIHEDDLNNPLVTDFLDILHQTVPLDN